MGNQDHLAMFFDVLSLQNQNPPVLPHEVTLQNQGLAYSQGFTNGSKSNFISDFPYKIKNHCMLGKRGFRGTILYRITVLSSQHLSRLQNQDLMDPKKDGFMKIKLLQNQESEFLQGVVHYKIKDLGIL